MTLEVLVWLFPAYIISLFHKHIASHRNQSGWDLIIRYGFTSTLIYSLSVFIELFIVFVLPQNASFFIRNFYLNLMAKFTHSSNLDLIPVGIFLSCLYGFLIIKVEFFNNLFKFIYYKINPLDPFMSFTKDIIEREGYALITLKSGKVYAGQLVNTTFDINENSRVLSVIIELSGYRKGEEKSLIFDKNYDLVGADKKLREILIPFTEVSSISPFDFSIHEKFVKLGITKLGVQNSEGLG